MRFSISRERSTASHRAGWVHIPRSEVGDHEARVGSLFHVFRLGDNPARARPAASGAVGKLDIASSRVARARPIALCLFHGVGDALQKTLVFGQSEEELHSVGLAPAHDRLSAEATVGPHQDIYQGPLVTDQLHKALQDLQRSVTGVDVGLSQLRPQKLIPQKTYSGR